MNLAITCFPTFGGSGVIATEIGLAMARRGQRYAQTRFDLSNVVDAMSRLYDQVLEERAGAARR